MRMLNKLSHHKKKIVIWVMICIIISTSHISFFKYGYNMNSKSDANTKNIIHKLHEINDSIVLMKTNPSTTSQQQDILLKLENDLSIIQKSTVDVAKSSDIQNISSQIVSMKDDVNSKMGDLKKMVSDSLGNKEYLDPSLLPFQVLSVDVISGQTYVSIDYANHMVPLGMGDSIAGWRISHADYESSSVEFVNEKNQIVKIHVKDV